MNKEDLAIYKELIDMGQITKPSYKTWLSRTFWAPFDTACLFNGIDPGHSFRIVTHHHDNTVMTTKKVLFFSIEEAEKYELSDDELIKANEFLKNISDEASAINTWQIPLHPLTLTNRYIQKIGDTPKELLELALEDFWELFQKSMPIRFAPKKHPADYLATEYKFL